MMSVVRGHQVACHAAGCAAEAPRELSLEPYCWAVYQWSHCSPSSSAVCCWRVWQWLHNAWWHPCMCTPAAFEHSAPRIH